MASQAQPRVLVVDDEDDVATIIALNLSLSGFAVDRAADGRQALEMIAAQPPDVVLLDVMMPVLDGWQVLRRLKEDETTAHIPVVMLTALSEEQDLIRGHLDGAVRYVTKPFEIDDLVATVQQALTPPDEAERERRRERTRSLVQRLAELDAGRDAGRPVRFSHLEAVPRSGRPDAPEVERSRLDQLTDNQRYVAAALAAGRSARDLADELGVSRSNVYATRKRVARKLGVRPEDVAEESRRLGL